MERYFTINHASCSICCKLYCTDPHSVRRIVVYGHGFCGHKETNAARLFADRLLCEHPDAAVCVFDWPCHGEDGRDRLHLDDAGLYLRELIAFLREEYPVEDLCGYATSYGGYLFLKYIREAGDPFRRIALRCPAVPMYSVLFDRIMSEADHAELAESGSVVVGFDRKIRVYADFLRELQETDLDRMDLSGFAEELLILHGTQDEIVPFSSAKAFAERNRIRFLPVEGADHRFQDPVHMDTAIRQILDFLAF